MTRTRWPGHAIPDLLCGQIDRKAGFGVSLRRRRARGLQARSGLIDPSETPLGLRERGQDLGLDFGASASSRELAGLVGDPDGRLGVVGESQVGEE